MGTARRLRRTAQKQGYLKSAKKQTFLKSVEGWGFPRRAFLQGVGVVALASTGILGYKHWLDNYSCKTWRPGKETWKPVIYAPSEEMDPVDKAIWLVKENICRYSIDDLKRMNLQPDQVYWMVSHQLRVKPITEEHIRFYLNALHIMEPPYATEKKLLFPVILQGHECQFLDTLFRSARNISNLNSKELDESWLSILRNGGTRQFKCGAQVTSLRSILINELGEYTPERLGLGNSDPSWLIGAFVGTNPTPEEWSLFGENDGMFRYVLYGLETIPEADAARFLYFSCGGTHFLDALSRLYWYYGQYSKEYEPISRLQEETLRWIKKTASVDELIQFYQEWLIRSMEDFHEESTKENFQYFYNIVMHLGHLLELILEPEGYYRNNLPLTTLEPVVKTLSEGIALWYTPKFDSKRDLLESWIHEDESPRYIDQLRYLSKQEKRQMKKITREMERYTSIENSESKYSRLFMGSLCHAARGLMLWKEYKQQWAEKHPNSN